MVIRGVMITIRILPTFAIKIDRVSAAYPYNTYQNGMRFCPKNAENTFGNCTHTHAFFAKIVAQIQIVINNIHKVIHSMREMLNAHLLS
jgi:hypothetical protein